jgi:hypothetical protein
LIFWYSWFTYQKQGIGLLITMIINFDIQMCTHWGSVQFLIPGPALVITRSILRGFK